MADLESWINYGDEMRRPLLISQKLADSSKVVIVGVDYLECALLFDYQEKDLI